MDATRGRALLARAHTVGAVPYPPAGYVSALLFIQPPFPRQRKHRAAEHQQSRGRWSGG